MYSYDTRPLTVLNKREEIATSAMNGILSNHWCQNHYNKQLDALAFEEVAKQAVGYADALLKELEKQPAP